MNRRTLAILIAAIAMFLLLTACTIFTQAADMPQPTTEPADASTTEAVPTNPATVPTVEQAPTAEPPTAAPAGLSISIDGVQFILPPELGTGANAAIVPEYQVPTDGFGENVPAYIQINLQGYPVVPAEGVMTAATIKIAYADGNIAGMMGDTAMIDAINSSPDMPLTQANIPSNYLLMASNIKRLTNENGSLNGARMLSLHGNGMILAANDGSLTYQYHAVTSDHRYYLILELPITSAMLPADMNAPVPDGGVNPANLPDITEYYPKVSELLNAQEMAGALSPSIALMDQLAGSIHIDSSQIVLPDPLPAAQ